MNRRQRRAANKRGITDKDLRQERFDGVRFAVKCYSIAVATVLRDELGFGAVRLNRTMNRIQGVFDSIQRNCVRIDDLERRLRDECGILFVENEINGK